MMTLMKCAAAAGFLVGVTAAANAQAQYQARYPYNPAPGSQASSWSYDPYTSGLGPCPQRRPGDTVPCRDQMPPTYGQPSYWSQQ